MDEMIDKLILIGLSMVLVLEKGGSLEPVAALLTAVVAGALGYYFEEKKHLYLLFAVIFVLSLLQPMCLLFFPVFLYDAVSKKFISQQEQNC